MFGRLPDRNVLVRDGFLTPEEVHLIGEKAALVMPMDAAMMVGSKKVRGGELRWLYMEHGWDWLHARVASILDEAEAYLNTVPSASMEAIQHTTYEAAESDWYDRHVDCFSRPPGMADRRLSISIQMTDPSQYGGGRLVLEAPDAPNPEAILAPGTAIIFRSDVWHTAMPITSGKRTSLVCWRSG